MFLTFIVNALHICYNPLSKEVNSMDKHEEEFSRRMLAYLELLNMTQNDLAKKMNVSPASVTLWIQGKKSPRMDKIDKMCEIFNCTRNDLLGEVIASEYSAEERSIIELYRKASTQKKHLTYLLLTLPEKEGGNE
jgi:transcriptional regulator with XRE-family HTH domain